MERLLRWINGYSPSASEKQKGSGFFTELTQKKEKLVEAVSNFFDKDDLDITNKAYRSVLGIPKFKSFLPYVGYLEEEGLFVLDGNGVDGDGTGVLCPGFVLEISPQTGADTNMEKILQSLFLQLPEGASVAVTLYGTPHIKERMKQRADAVLTDLEMGIDKEPWEVRNSNFYRTFIRSRIDFYVEGAFESKVPSAKGALFRDFRVILSVVLPENILSNGAIEEAMGVRDGIEQTFRSALLPTEKWNADDLLNWVSDLLEHDRVLDKKKKYVYKKRDPLQPILKDCFSNTGGVSHIEKTKINNSTFDSSLVTMSVTDFPSKPWFLSNMGNLIGDSFQANLAYPCPFMITMIAVTGDRSSFKNKATMTAARKTQLSTSQSGKYIPGIMNEAAEWRYAQQMLEDGATMVNMGVKVTLISPKKEAKKNIQSVKAIWSNNGFTIHEDTFLQALGFKSILPMGVNKVVYDDLMSMGHLSPKFSNNAISLSPLIAEWKGTQHNTITLFGRRGQIMGFDLFDNDQGNMNFAVIAGSGSGKSFLCNEIIMSYLSIGGKAWIIDVGRSYEKLCDVVGGNFLEFSESSKIILNPFTFVKDLSEEMDLIKPLLSQMMTGSDATLSPVEMADLGKVVTSAFAKYGNDLTITLVRDELDLFFEKEQMVHLKNMSKMLHPWTKDGDYGRWFEGKANLDFSGSFTVLELEELGSKKPLQTVVLMILMYRITDEMYVNRDGTKKIVLIDEAWDLMDGGDTAEFIEKGYRRARKYGGSFGTATQRVDDYYKNAGSQAALDNSDTVFMLRQRKEAIEMMEKDGKIVMDSWKKRQLISLQKNNHFSEVYISSPMGEGLGRLFVDPFTILMYSTKDEDYQAVKRYKDNGLNTTDAINSVLRDRGLLPAA